MPTVKDFRNFLIATISRADLMIPPETESSRIQLTRRQTIPISTGKDVYFASPEDVIINKLICGKQSQSEKQWRDVLSIMKTQRESLEYNYLKEWTNKWGITSDYLQATIEAGVSDFTQ